ncbi:MAG: nucleoside 2-deoxyribosyltransferase [Planctomycetota bacterium]|nr:nucleoside 2-deoxyribosyltransferase [Planctomycetota bacterium]
MQNEAVTAKGAGEAAGLRIYLAGPLFTIQERRTNRQLAHALEGELAGAQVLLPQDFKHEGRYNPPRAFGLIFRSCLEGVDSCHCVVALLDGPDCDSGTSFEVGYAFAKGIPVVGVRTDFRLNQERGVNLMLSRACTAFVYRPSFDEDLVGLARAIARGVRKVTKK